ncbi:haloacid dehalogenase-like hydrolase domain-containing 5 [Portunus trituberculatus]|uniref:Haloacid dehalogenase-like hydrolase domain-containing 5 n=1 Tax=Portunus trituberculatus TaxID=210409 RepID=A0A5B7DTZ2_PORTR|nr:haloacid dehalogenase-like hydrolase domain-containing 5 [Portunus trituberculatus]MPC24908.1 Cat eye syndrome critical region protein 5 [Portunus trituberculatus]
MSSLRGLILGGKQARIHPLLVKVLPNHFTRRNCSQRVKKSGKSPDFGLLFDIDGVIIRGQRILPSAPEAFTLLVDDDGRFRVPTVFVTNAGNALRSQKAEQLSKWLGLQVHEDQVVMAHSPLKMFDQYFNKEVLISGQGPTTEIAHNLGFLNTTTVDDLCLAFPLLDCVDHKKRSAKPPATPAPKIPKIDAVMLFGEPVRWETSLQLLLDVLMTDGDLMGAPTAPYPHLPILACNMDLQWMAEAHMPRFGHGAFLLCLEALYKKVTGKDLIYTALVGKPSEITYYHAETMVQHHARSIGITHPITKLYAIGDNVHTDIFGMNLYREYVRRHRHSKSQVAMQGARGLDLSTQDFRGLTADQCYSVLVRTGVYNEENGEQLLEHSPRDFLPIEAKLQEPSLTVKCVLEAIHTIYQREKFS